MMALFWMACGGLMLALIALVLLPLLRPGRPDGTDAGRENLRAHREALRELERQHAEGRLVGEEYLALRDDLEVSLARDLRTAPQAGPAATVRTGWGLPATIAVVLPAAAVLLYGQWGWLDEANAWRASPENPANRVAVAPEEDNSIESMVRRLEARVREDPRDLQARMLLGRTYRALERYEDAWDTLWQARQLAPERVELLALLVETRFLAGDGHLDEQGRDLLEALVRRQPDHPDALNLQAVAAYRQGEPAAAADYWERLLDQNTLPDDERRPVERALARARARAGLTTDGVTVDGDAPATVTLTVEVRLDETLRDIVSPEDPVFVFARHGAGPPVAVQRLRVADLPATVRLDDDSAMSPSRPLSSVSEVEAGARVARAGTATATSGDLEGRGPPVPLTPEAATEVIIDRQLE